MTSRASEIGFLTVLNPDTAPHRLLGPSMILASISTLPFSFRADPRPELKKGSVSNSLTCFTHTQIQDINIITRTLQFSNTSTRTNSNLKGSASEYNGKHGNRKRTVVEEQFHLIPAACLPIN